MNTIDKTQILEFLKNSRYFKNISEETLQKFLILSTYKQYQVDEIILKQGSLNDKVFVLLKGSIKVYVDDQYIYSLHRIGDIFGEMSVVSESVCSASIIASSPLELIIISMSNLEQPQQKTLNDLNYLIYKWFTRILTEKLNLTSAKAKLHEELNKKMQQDLESAKLVQQQVFEANIIPIPNLKLDLKSVFTDFLGGDFYGVFNVNSQHYGILLGDVSGHGTPASLLALSTLTLFHNFSGNQLSCSKVLESVNSVCQHSLPSNCFVTAFYAIYNPHSLLMIYAYAGHHPVMSLKGSRVELLPLTTGLPLGMFHGEMNKYSQHTHKLEMGERLFIFTDGVFEGFEERGLKILQKFIEDNAHLPSDELCEAIYQYTSKNCQEGYADDFTLMIFTVITP